MTLLTDAASPPTQNGLSNLPKVSLNQSARLAWRSVNFVSQGKILDVAAKPGAYKWQDDTSPSFFAGSFSDVVRHGWQRFTFGGQNPVQQRLYYVNTKDLPGFRFGTPSPIGFRVVDRTTGLDLETTIRCNGTSLLHVVDTVRLYTAFAGNIANEYTVDNLDDPLRAEFVQALQPAFGEFSARGLRPSELAEETKAISEAVTFSAMNNRAWSFQPFLPICTELTPSPQGESRGPATYRVWAVVLQHSQCFHRSC